MVKLYSYNVWLKCMVKFWHPTSVDQSSQRAFQTDLEYMYWNAFQLSTMQFVYAWIMHGL